jgi:hypothetical protein
MRVLLERRFGRSLDFIAVIEFQKSGLAHFHILFGIFIPQSWLSETWQSVGGGEIVDIRYVEVRRVAAYVTTYVTGEKIEHTLSLLPPRARIFTTSRSLKLSPSKKGSGWWLKRKHIRYLRNNSSDVTKERYEVLETGRPAVLMKYEATVGMEDVRNRSVFDILKRMIAVREKRHAG